MVKPSYTTIIHVLRRKYKLTNDDYCVVDSIHKLSNNPDFPWCRTAKRELGEFLNLSERTIYRICEKMLKLGFLEKSEDDIKLLRTTKKWNEEIELLKENIFNK